MPNLNNNIAALAAASLGLDSVKGFKEDIDFRRSIAAPASTLITTPKE